MKLRLIPKSRQGTAKTPERRYLQLFAVFLSLGVILLFVDSPLLRPHLHSWFGIRDVRTEINKESMIRTESEFVRFASSTSKIDLIPCRSRDETKVDESDIADYLSRSNDLLSKIFDFEKLLGHLVSKNERIHRFNSLVSDSQGLTDFYNERLVRCYLNESDAVSVSKRSAIIRESLEILRRKI